MKNGTGLLLVAAAVLILGGVAVATTSKLRGLRNNNPGNIKELQGDKTQWVGERATDDDPVFEEFQTMADGVRALALVLKTYATRYQLVTVRGIITRWAPGSENNTAAYIASVCKALNVTADQRIDVLARMPELVWAIAKHENGPAETSLYLTDATVREGVRRAGIA